MSCSPPSCNPDFPTHAQTSCSSSSSSPSTMTTSRSHDPMILNSDCHSDVIITDYNHTHFADGEEKKKKRTKKEVITDREVKKVVHRLPKADNMVMNMTAVSAKNAAKTKMRLLSGNNVKKREKAYRCPVRLFFFFTPLSILFLTVSFYYDYSKIESRMYQGK